MPKLLEHTISKILSYSVTHHHLTVPQIAEMTFWEPKDIRRVLRPDVLYSREARYRYLLANPGYIFMSLFHGEPIKVAPGFQVLTRIAMIKPEGYEYRGKTRNTKVKRMYLFLTYDVFTEQLVVVPMRGRTNIKMVFAGLQTLMQEISVERIHYLNHFGDDDVMEVACTDLKIHRVGALDYDFSQAVIEAEQQLAAVKTPTPPMDILMKVGERFSGSPPGYIKDVSVDLLHFAPPEMFQVEGVRGNIEHTIPFYRAKRKLVAIYDGTLAPLRYEGILTTEILREFRVLKSNHLWSLSYAERNLGRDQQLDLDGPVPLEIRVNNERIAVDCWARVLAGILDVFRAEYPREFSTLALLNADIYRLNDSDVFNELKKVIEAFPGEIKATYHKRR